MVQYSLVIVTYNCKEESLQCIESIRQCYPGTDVQVIVVDNASTDETGQVLESYLKNIPNASIIRNSKNQGFAKACNQGAQCANAQLILFLNPDTLLTKGSLESMAAPLLQSKQVGATGPLSNFAAGWQNLRYVFNYETMGDANLPSQKDVVASELKKTLDGQAKEVRMLIGFCLMIRKDLFFDIGMMDESLILGMDDLDISWRLRLLGKQLIVVYDAFVHHKGQVSFNASPSATVERMKKESRVNFSKKLIEHYGARESVPSSWDLWEIDWFELEDQSSIDNSLSAKQETAKEVKDETMGVSYCILARSGRVSRKNIENTVDNLFELGVADEDIVVVNTTSLPMTQSFIAKDVFEWNVPPETQWSDVIKRARRWFTHDAILFIEGGVTIPMFHFKALAQLAVKEKNCHGRLLQIEEGTITSLPTLSFDYSQAVNAELPPYFLLHNSAESPVTLEYTEQILLHTQVAVDTELPPTNHEEKRQEIPDGLPSQIYALVKENPQVCFWGKGQSLDIRGKEVNPNSCSLIVYRITVSDIRGLSQTIKQYRHGALNKVAVIFDNSMVQTGTDVPYSNKGVLPVDVIRELQLAGFSIQNKEAYECQEKSFNAQYTVVESQSEYFTHDERLYGTAEKIIITATPCREEYDLSKKVSIVMLALNKVEYTRQCIESIQQYTRQNYELILINNGSTDGTREYFDSIPGAIVIHNSENRGVAAGWNQGIDKASGEYILIFNNDTIVGPNSIENLVRASMNHPDAGMIAPRSNSIAGPQVVENFTYSGVNEIPLLLEKYQKANDLAAWEFTRIKGFCMLMPRQVVVQTGYFDERFGYGNFEDDDYSCRILYSGKKLMVADDSLIFHYGSVSFGQANCDWNELMIKNQKLFNEKWKKGRGSLNMSGGIPTVTSIPVEIDNNSLVSGQVHDVDKSSPGWSEYTNGNLERANNLFLEEVTLNDKNASSYFGMGLVALQQNRAMEAFTFFCRSLELDGSLHEVSQAIVDFLKSNSAFTDMKNVIEVLVQKHPDNKHFKELQSDLNGDVRLSMSPSWKDEVETLIDAHEFIKASAILNQKLKNGEEGFEVYNMLGVIAYYQEIYDEAFKMFQKALSYNASDEDTLLNIYDAGLRLKLLDKTIELMALGLTLKPDMADVRRCYEEALNARSGSLVPDDLIYYREMNIGAETLIREGMLEKAEAVIDDLLKKSPDNYRALNNKGLVLWYANKMEEAYVYFKKSLDANIWYTDGIVNLYDCALVIERKDEFMQYLHRALQVAPSNRELIAIKSEINSNTTPERLKDYFAGQELSENEKKVSQAKSLMENQEYESAVLLFTEVLEREPENADCYNGLGIIAFYWGNFNDAFKLISRAVEITPLDEDALLNLWDVAGKIDRQHEVREVLEMALSLDPGLTLVSETLGN